MPLSGQSVIASLLLLSPTHSVSMITVQSINSTESSQTQLMQFTHNSKSPSPVTLSSSCFEPFVFQRRVGGSDHLGWCTHKGKFPPQSSSLLISNKHLFPIDLQHMYIFLTFLSQTYIYLTFILFFWYIVDLKLMDNQTQANRWQQVFFSRLFLRLALKNCRNARFWRELDQLGEVLTIEFKC